jgi:hypothetical protein
VRYIYEQCKCTQTQLQAQAPTQQTRNRAPRQDAHTRIHIHTHAHTYICTHMHMHTHKPTSINAPLFFWTSLSRSHSAMTRTSASKFLVLAKAARTWDALMCRAGSKGRCTLHRTSARDREKGGGKIKSPHSVGCFKKTPSNIGSLPSRPLSCRKTSVC